jgi:tetratricopeptide (TPR) repeat protein
MTRHIPRTVLAICILMLVLVRVAHAEDPEERAAKRHYERGQKLFGIQKFNDALEQFQQAFDAKPIPAFLFNIGQCHRNLGDYAAAIFSFKRFLKLDPEADNRSQVEELIEELEQKQAEGDTARLGLGKRPKPDEEDDDEEEEPTETPDGAPVYRKWWFWTGVAVVGVAAGAGLYFATKSSGGPPGTDLGHIDYPR